MKARTTKITWTAGKLVVVLLAIFGALFLVAVSCVVLFYHRFSGDECLNIYECAPYWGIRDLAAPQWTPDGSRIVFGYGRNIYSVTTDGTNIELVDGDGGKDTATVSPDVSPDGSRVVYVAREGDNWEIVSSAIDGSDRQQLTDWKGDDTDPAWSPDGRLIAFVSENRDERNRTGLYVMAADGSNVRPVVTFGDLGAALSASYPDFETGTDLMRRSVNWAGLGVPPAWSPDGHHLAFRVDVARPIEWAIPDVLIGVVGVDGSGLALLDGDLGVPGWSPDGRHIAFGKTKSEVTQEKGIEQLAGLYVADADGSNVREIVELPDTGRNNVGYLSWRSISWSPDGSAILFGYYLIQTDGSVVARLPGHYTSWSPDGSKIAVNRNDRVSRGPILTVGKDGSDVRVMVEPNEHGELVVANGRPWPNTQPEYIKPVDGS